MKTNLVVDQAPLLEERVYPHYGAHVSREVAPAGSNSKILARVEAVGVDHEVAVVLVHVRGLATVSVVEEFRQGLLLDLVDGVHVEPCTVTWKDDGVCLRYEVFPSCTLNRFFRPHFRLSFSWCILARLGLCCVLPRDIIHLLVIGGGGGLCGRSFWGVHWVV
jgi:hypothetical protein